MRRHHLFVALVVAFAVVAAACGGSGEGDREPAAVDAPATLLGPDVYADRMANPEAVVINVHIPYEGEIEGTDVHIPFDAIVGDERLPADKDTEILLYCRSGNMTVDAAEALTAAGYTNLYDLEGGMKAWEAAGRPLVHTPA